MQERFLLVTDGPINAHRFLVIDLEDTYHRTTAYATSWAEGTQLCEYLNRGARDLSYWEQTAADLKSVERRGYRPLGDGTWDDLKRDIDAEIHAGPKHEGTEDERP